MIDKIKNKLKKLIDARHWAARINDNFYKDVSRFYRTREPLIFYVGANVGQEIRPMKRYMPTSTIHCFEPLPANVARLRRRAARHKNVSVHSVGVGDQPGELFIVPHDNPTMTKLVGENTGGLEQVSVVTLDSFCAAQAIEKIAILKIDVEGMEMDVLQGATGLLSRGAVDCVYLECGINPDNAWHTSLRNVSDALEPLGFRIMRFYEQIPEWPKRQPHLRRADVAFIAPSIHAQTWPR